MATDLYGLLGVEDPRKQEALRMGLLQGGLGILANAYSPYGGGGLAAIGRGGLMGVDAYQQALQQQQQQEFRSLQMRAAMQKFNREQAEQAAIDELARKDPERAKWLRLNPDAAAAEQFKTPMGFRRTAENELTPASIRLPDGTVMDYATYQQQLAAARSETLKQIPGFGEAERLNMARGAQVRAESAAQRAEESMGIQQERLDLARQSAERAKLLTVPTKVENGYIGNTGTLGKLNEAIALVESNPDAFDWRTLFGTGVASRVDPKGIKARSAVSDIGSLQIHDRTGSAQTFHETQRMRPFVPDVQVDSSKKILENLLYLRNLVLMEQKAMRERYAQPDKYKNPLEVGEFERDAVLDEMRRAGELPPDKARELDASEADIEAEMKKRGLLNAR